MQIPHSDKALSRKVRFRMRCRKDTKYYVLLVLLFIFKRTSAVQIVKCQNATSGSNANCLLEKLLTGYDKRLRPRFPGPPLHLTAEILLSNVFGVSEVQNEFGLEIYLRQFWNDPRLRFLKHNFSKPLFLNTETISELWIPSTYFIRSKHAFRHHITTDNILLRISPSGDIFYSQRLSVVTSCIMDLRYFPHDSQVCHLFIESYAYQETDIIYSWGSTMKSDFKNLQDSGFDIPSFTLVGVELSEGRSQYSIGNHSNLLASFTFTRRVGFFLIETYIPSCIVVIISWVSFWIPSDSAPARVSLGITTILTMTTISSATRQSLPKVSYVKVVDWFLLACLLFVFAALLEYAFVVYYNSKPKTKDSMAQEMDTVRQQFERTSTEKLQEIDGSRHNTFERQRFISKDQEVESWIYGHVEDRGQEDAKGYQRKWFCDIFNVPTDIDQYARKGFPLAFLLFILLYCLNVILAKRKH